MKVFILCTVKVVPSRLFCYQGYHTGGPIPNPTFVFVVCCRRPIKGGKDVK